METSATLLDRLHGTDNAAAWQRMVSLYTPLIRGWLLRQNLPPQDADDVVQEILTVVVRRFPKFQRQPRTGAFRCWLRTITANCLHDFWRKRRKGPLAGGAGQAPSWLDELADSDSALSRQWDLEHEQYLFRRLLEILRPRFEPMTWRAFELVTLAGKSPQEAAAELGVTVNSVFIAKSRVLSLLRQEAADLID